tara:strand:+ start:32976 stop:33380 length:405 start_codon:yes stop_codon:yes gene_type:complete
MSKVSNTCIIDDDPICIFGLKRTMKELDFSNEIIVYKNGLEAINGLKNILAEGQKLPATIFLDLNMPIMDGWDFLNDFEKIQNHDRDNVNIYIISSSVDSRDLQKAKRYSAVSDYFIKPFTTKDLNKIISNLPE